VIQKRYVRGTALICGCCWDRQLAKSESDGEPVSQWKEWVDYGDHY